MKNELLINLILRYFMDEKKLLKRTICLLLSTGIAVVFCYFFVDRQVAIWIFKQGYKNYHLLKYLSHLPDLIILMALVIYISLVVQYSCNQDITEGSYKWLVFANGIAITQFFKTFLKSFFGRYWPETWYESNPSLIHNNQYGFHPFHQGVNYASFPSGHAATIFAAITILWIIYPRFRWLYLLLTFISLTSLLLMNYHFVGDIIAGALLGYLVAIYTFMISRRFLPGAGNYELKWIK